MQHLITGDCKDDPKNWPYFRELTIEKYRLFCCKKCSKKRDFRDSIWLGYIGASFPPFLGFQSRQMSMEDIDLKLLCFRLINKECGEDWHSRCATFDHWRSWKNCRTIGNWHKKSFFKMLPKNIKRYFFQNQYRCATCWHRLRRKLVHLRVWAQQIGRPMCLSSKKNVKNTCEKTWSFWFGRVVFVKWAMVRPHGPLYRHFVNTTHTKLQKIIKKT